VINSIRGFLKTYGIHLGSSGEKEFPAKVRSQLSGLFEVAQEGIESLINCYEKLCKEIQKLECRIEKLAKEDEDIKRLMTVPGVGLITAMTFKTEIDDP
jgi:transposase